MVQKEKPFPPKTHVVAFIDILGFSRLMPRIVQDADLFNWLLLLFEEVLSDDLPETDFLQSLGQFPKVAMSSVSDSTVISAVLRRPSGMTEWLVAQKASDHAIRLLKYGIFCRGGIAVGALHHKGTVVFGPGLIHAYEIESKAAHYPRIVLADEVAENLKDQFSEPNPAFCLTRDADGLWFLDLFRRVAEDREGTSFLRRIRQLIEQQLDSARTETEISRWRWCAQRYNAVVEIAEQITAFR